MRLSGTYFERLLYNVLPWMLFSAILTYLIKGSFHIYVLMILTLVFWAADTLIIYFKFKNPKRLKIDHTLMIGAQVIKPTDIKAITPYTDKRMSWSFKMIKFALTDGRIYYVIDKPQILVKDFMRRPSETMNQLFAEYPELKTKLTTRETF